MPHPISHHYHSPTMLRKWQAFCMPQNSLHLHLSFGYQTTRQVLPVQRRWICKNIMTSRLPLTFEQRKTSCLEGLLPLGDALHDRFHLLFLDDIRLDFFLKNRLRYTADLKCIMKNKQVVGLQSPESVYFAFKTRILNDRLPSAASIDVFGVYDSLLLDVLGESNEQQLTIPIWK
jgi:hypothetical protein